ncbi:MAG TPA: hypothetical protein VF746_09270 [Longimicrobium sp.]|jgi:hypothetical protein
MPSRTTRALALLCALSTMVVATSCSERPAPTESAPISTGDPQNLLILDPLLDQLLMVDVLQRTTPLASDITVSKSFDYRGGTLSIPQAGLSVRFPQYALPVSGTQKITITVTALKGRGVAYDFAPHGIRFRTPAVMTQELANTAAVGGGIDPLRLEGAYFPTLSSLLSDVLALVSETRPTAYDARKQTTTWTAEHFSGYAVSSGRRGYLTASDTRLPTDLGSVQR